MPVAEPIAPAATDFTLDALTRELAQLDLPAYRARQLFRGVHRRHVRDWAGLTDLPAGLRRRLATRLRLSALEVAAEQRSTDGTVKLLLRASDDQTFESVQIPAGIRAPAPGVRASGAYPTRLTVCVSSQAGCALACRFCATGQMGFGRNLTVGEIVEQVYWAERPGAERRVDNVVFMGMGEPLANYERVVAAIRVLADKEGYGFSPRRVTVSTAGIVPALWWLADEGLEVRLAVSLHAPNDELRSALMPINRRFPLADLLAAAGQYAERSGRRVSYEYVMLEGVNDSDAHAAQLGALLRHRHAHVNLIPYNQTFAGYRSSPPQRVRRFADELRTCGVACTIRASRGRDIAAACGQLKVEQLAVARPGGGEPLSDPHPVRAQPQDRGHSGGNQVADADQRVGSLKHGVALPRRSRGAGAHGARPAPHARPARG